MLNIRKLEVNIIFFNLIQSKPFKSSYLLFLFYYTFITNFFQKPKYDYIFNFLIIIFTLNNL